jgi:hypothetical protein
VNLPRPRDQLSTREHPEFLRLRRQLFDSSRRPSREGNSAKALCSRWPCWLAFEFWARATHLQSDSLAPPSEIVMALIGAFADFSILPQHATRCFRPLRD